LLEENPFGDIDLTRGTRTHVTFLKKRAEKADLPSGKGLDVLGVFDGAVCSVVHPSGTTPDLMSALDKRFGKEVTTRTWKTVERIVETRA
jgi:hypothetical protein